MVPVSLSSSRRSYSDGIESVEAFQSEWVSFFQQAPDLFELQRGLNNCFAYDIVPTVPILREAILASRRLNTFSTSLRIFGGLRAKVENEKQYKMYCEALRDVREELGIPLPEELGV